MDKITKLPWFATRDRYTNDERDNVWTVSPDPNETGWETDSGFPGYGLSKADAEYICRAVNSHEGLVSALKLACLMLNDFAKLTNTKNDFNKSDNLHKILEALKAADGEGVK